MSELLNASTAHGLDFQALTDHNTVSGLQELGSDRAHVPLLLPGMELTTYHGHALALGRRTWVDWRTGRAGRTMPDAAREVMAGGGLFVIAHPRHVGDPECTGCRWLYDDMLPGPARHVEIWNGGLDRARNEEGLRLWYGWLDRGFRVFATAGTDAHGPGGIAVGKGFNVVRAERSAAAVLEALRAGRSYVSRGPHLELAVEGDGGATASGPGGVARGGSLRARARWDGVAADGLTRLLVNGREAACWPGRPSGDGAYDLRAPTAGWAVLEARDGDGALAGVTNPVFVEP